MFEEDYSESGISTVQTLSRSKVNLATGWNEMFKNKDVPITWLAELILIRLNMHWKAKCAAQSKKDSGNSERDEQIGQKSIGPGSSKEARVD